MDLKNMTAKDVYDCIMYHSLSISDDEWLELSIWIDEFLKSDPSPEEKKMFVPLGCAEIVGMVCDGITRWRKSNCFRCKKKQGKEHCEIYPENENSVGGIPSEIWAFENANCSFYEPEN